MRRRGGECGAPEMVSHSDGSGVPMEFSCDSAETRGLRVFSSQKAGSYVNTYRVVKGVDDEVDICYYSDSYFSRLNAGHHW